jgi:hypothetical protein
MEDEFTDWLDAQSKDRIHLAFERAKKRDTEWWDDESFEAVLMEEVYLLYIKDTTRMLTNEGYLEAHAREDGQLGYTLTDKGREFYDDTSSA